MFISKNVNFFDEQLVSRYLRYCRASDQWTLYRSTTVWNERVIHHPSLPNTLRQCNLAVLDTIRQKIRSDFKLTKKLYPDYLGLVRWRIGDSQDPHADAENPDGSLHQYHWRKIGCVLYLNDDYQGGEIYFPNQRLELKPQPNTLMFFPGTLEYLHGVRSITSGVRYTLTSFWTFDRNHSILCKNKPK
jgi:prolyl 4-hydroxylase